MITPMEAEVMKMVMQLAMLFIVICIILKESKR